MNVLYLYIYTLYIYIQPDQNQNSYQIFLTYILLSRLSMCSPNREQIFRLPKSSLMIVCILSLLITNSSPINRSISWQSCTSMCCIHLIMTGASICQRSTRMQFILSRLFPSRKHLMRTLSALSSVLSLHEANILYSYSCSTNSSF